MELDVIMDNNDDNGNNSNDNNNNDDTYNNNDNADNNKGSLGVPPPHRKISQKRWLWGEKCRFWG